MHDVIIVDEEFEAVSSEIKKVAEKIDSLIDSYLRVMNQVTANAVTSGETAEALRVYISYAELLKGAVTVIAESQNLNAQYFLDNIDQTDSYLY